MKPVIECTSCLVRQAVEVISRHCNNKKKQQTVLKKVLRLLSSLDLSDSPPPFLARHMHDLLQLELGTDDLYRNEKRESNAEALALEPILVSEIATAPDPLLLAARLSIAGNIIDYGIHATFDIHQTIERVLEQPFTTGDYASFLRQLEGKRNHILYISDNAGEIVFDKLFIKELLKRNQDVLLAVKSAPILNDATMVDVIEAGLDRLVPVIESGSNIPGLDFSRTTPEFDDHYRKADLIILKGQGNLETAYGERTRPGKFFLMSVKCLHVSQFLNCAIGDTVFLEEKD